MTWVGGERFRGQCVAYVRLTWDESGSYKLQGLFWLSRRCGWFVQSMYRNGTRGKGLLLARTLRSDQRASAASAQLYVC